MYRRSIISPFIGGVNTDQPSWLLDPRECTSSLNYIAPFGVAQQRRGWAFDGTTADVADALVGVFRSKFILNGNTRTFTVDDDGDMFSHNPSSAGTSIFTGSVVYLPRAMYRDELMICAQDGVTPMRRWAGSLVAGTYSDAVGNWIQNESRITSLVSSPNPDVGTFARDTGSPDVQYWKIVNASSSAITIEDAFYPGTTLPLTISTTQTGLTNPVVEVYNAGTFTSSAGVMTGLGTKWNSDIVVVAGQDAVLTSISAGVFNNARVTATTDDDTITANLGTIATSQTYSITRPCPFKDVASHRDSFWGTGTAQYPNRVYVSPPGWNPSAYPGYVLPYNPVIPNSVNRGDFLLDTVDVPTPYEGDTNVAILSSSNPLLVIKQHDVYGIFGNWPIFSTELLQEGAGCIDIRSANTLPMGPVWAGRNGIFTYQNGRIIDLTKNRINREWRNQVRTYNPSLGDTVATGQVKDHLFVTFKITGTATGTWVFDIKNGVWISKFSNHDANFYFSSAIPGEDEEMYWVDGPSHQGRVMKSSSIFGNTAALNVRDGDAVKPMGAATTGTNLSGKGPEAETTWLDVSLVATVYDGGSNDSSRIDLTPVTHDALTNTDGTGIGVTISSDSFLPVIDGAIPGPSRGYGRRVNMRGRRHRASVAASAYDTSQHASGALISIASMQFTFEDTADRT